MSVLLYVKQDPFSPFLIPEGLTKSPYSRLLHQIPPLLTGLVQSFKLLPCTPRSSSRMDFSSEDLVIGGHSVHLREESGLARDRRMLSVQCPEQTLTALTPPM
jgi:hypothetical protein